MPNNSDILISICNLILILDPSYTLDHILTRSNIFQKLNGCDTHEVSILFKIIATKCDLSEYADQGYLDEFLASLERPEEVETKDNFLEAMTKLDEYSLIKVTNWRSFIGLDEHSLTILGIFSAADHPVDMSEFLPSLI